MSAARIEAIRARVALDLSEFSKHAADRSIRRGILVAEVREAIGSSVVIEDYPGDKYGPSRLVLGTTGPGRPLHIRCSHASRPLIKIIAVYEPDPDLWIDNATRKRGE